MSKTLTESPITTRNARKGLSPGLHWRAVDADSHLGYRRAKRGGSWLVRWRNGKGYKQAPLGTADDSLTEGTLDYEGAMRAARQHVEAVRAQERIAAAGPVLTVGDTVEAYVAARDSKVSKRAGREIRSDAGQRLRRYVLGQDQRGKQEAIPASALSKILFHEMSEDDLLTWRAGLPKSLKAATVRRLTNDLKAGLNRGYALNKKRLPATISAVIKGGLSTPVPDDDQAEPVARENQILGDGEIRRLLIAAKDIDNEQEWNGDFFRLILVMASTGARFSQVVRIRVRDLQIGPKRIMMPVSRKGRGGHAGATGVPVGSDVVEALLPATLGRDPDAILLERWRSRQVSGAIRWEKSERGPWSASAEFARPWKTVVARAGLAATTIPYSLRHSSIVRGIRQNLPIRLVAALHNTSVAMIEAHYSLWISDGLADMARDAVIDLLTPEASSNVIQLPRT